MMISKTVTDLKGSPTAQIFILAKKLEMEENRDIIHLEIGQPDFQPFSEIIDSTIEATRAGKTTYTMSTGIPELRKEIARAYHEDYQTDVDWKNEIIITSGAKLGIYAALFSILDKGDKIIVPEPYWVSYPDMIQLAGGAMIPIAMTENFNLDHDAILSAIEKDRPKAIILNSPNNPSGHVLTRKEISFLKDLIEDFNLIIISDEIYNEYIFSDNPIRTLLTEFDWRDNIIAINGFSKTFSMTGYRLGYTISNKTIAEGINKIIQASTSCPTNFCQWAAITAIQHREKARTIINTTFPERREILIEEITKTDGFEISEIDGAFYGFMKYTYTKKSAEDVVKDILIKANVATIPGTAFGASANAYIRVTFARSIEEIREAFHRIRTYLKD
jgi:aspartate/methionine/tyrosine aminotransferase